MIIWTKWIKKMIKIYENKNKWIKIWINEWNYE